MSLTTDISIKEGGSIGIYYLKKIWQYHLQLRFPETVEEKIEWKYINGVFNALGIGLEPGLQYLLGMAPSFEEFENWIKENGRISPRIIQRFNAIIDGESDLLLKEREAGVLNQADLAHWEKKGYLILKDAVPKEDCAKAVELIYNSIEADPNQPTTWYKDHKLKKGIMVQLFNDPILDKIRFSPKIQMAYEQLWKRGDLMVSNDRVGFNPPETEAFPYQGDGLHWDVSLKRPIPFGLQGILYLADTAKNQGAFTVIPGFHLFIDDWLNKLGENINPRSREALDAFESESIAASAGDFIIWNQCLPHGSSPNTSETPRLVQYINYQPLDMEYREEWI